MAKTDKSKSTSEAVGIPPHENAEQASLAIETTDDEFVWSGNHFWTDDDEPASPSVEFGDFELDSIHFSKNNFSIGNNNCLIINNISIFSIECADSALNVKHA